MSEIGQGVGIERQQAVLARLKRLAATPPQSLVLEGGLASEREALALHWACLLNCESRGTGAAPCGSCPACRQIRLKAFGDLIVVDENFFGEGSSVAVEAVREVMPVWGQPPRGDGARVTVFPEAQDLNPFVANTLLKTLEEPRPGNVFVLLAPQRERLLPTLVSRSFVLTLAWPDRPGLDPEEAEWIEALLHFWRTGQGWFERTLQKGRVDKALAHKVLLGCQRALALALAQGAGPDLPGRLAEHLCPSGLRRLDQALCLAQDALTTQPAAVNPALVLDWLATQACPR